MKRIIRLSIMVMLAAILLMACGKQKNDDGAGVVYEPGQQSGAGEAGGAGNSSFDDAGSYSKPSSGGNSGTASGSFSDGNLSDSEDDFGGQGSSNEEGSGSDIADAGSLGIEGIGDTDDAAANGAEEGSDIDNSGMITGGLSSGDAGVVTGGLSSEAGDSSDGTEDGNGGSAIAEPLDEDGIYTTLADVSFYLYTYEKLPVNFITKKQARSLGWSGGGLDKYANGFCIGGDVFGNYEGLLPEKKGRVYHECDIDTLHQKSRGAKRIVYSDDGLIYYTDDHYDSFTLIYNGWASDQNDEETEEGSGKQ